VGKDNACREEEAKKAVRKKDCCVVEKLRKLMYIRKFQIIWSTDNANSERSRLNLLHSSRAGHLGRLSAAI